MPILRCYIDDRTQEVLEKIARQLDRTVEDLAECAIAEVACESIRNGSVVLDDQG